MTRLNSTKCDIMMILAKHDVDIITENMRVLSLHTENDFIF